MKYIHNYEIHENDGNNIKIYKKLQNFPVKKKDV